jgi:hypothetical protein
MYSSLCCTVDVLMRVFSLFLICAEAGGLFADTARLRRFSRIQCDPLTACQATQHATGKWFKYIMTMNRILDLRTLITYKTNPFDWNEYIDELTYAEHSLDMWLIILSACLLVRAGGLRGALDGVIFNFNFNSSGVCTYFWEADPVMIYVLCSVS